MNQQNQGSGFQSNVPIKRKRGRPRKEGSVVQGENVPVMPGSDNVLNSNQTAGTSTTDDCDDEMVGKLVTGVIEGTFNAGYLLNVKVEDTDAFLRGLVFLPGQAAPVTVENDVAPHVKMIKRKEIPIPVLNPQAEIHGSVPSSVQCNKQSFEPELQVPMSEEQVLPTEIHSGISGLLENQSASTLIPISSGGIPPGTSEPEHVNQSATIMSELDHDKNMKQGETSHELEASTQVKEFSADGGETKDSEAASELINLLPSIEISNKDLRTEQQAVPYVHQLNEVIHDEPNISNIKLSLIPLSAEPEALPSEQTSKTVNYFVEKQELPKTDVLEDTKTKLAIDTSQPESMPSEQIDKSVPSESKFSFEGHDFWGKSDPQNCSSFGDSNKVTKLAIETLSNVDTLNTSGRPSTDVNIPVVGSSHTLETSQPESMPSERIGESVPSESKFTFEGHDLWGKSDPQNSSSFGDSNKVTKLAIETLSNADTLNTNGRPSTDVNIPVVGSSHTLETSQPESMPSERVGESVPSESKFTFEGHDLWGTSDPQNSSSFGDSNKVTKLAIDTLSNVDTLNTNGRPSTDVNIPVVGSSHTLETSQPESMPSERIGESVPSESKFTFEGHDLWGKSDPQNCSSFGDSNKVTKLATETLSNVDTSNSNGRPSADVVNIPVLESNHTLETSQPESMPSEQIVESVPSESKFPFEGHDLWGKSDPQNCSSFGDSNKGDFSQPTESLANSMESEKQIGSGTS